MKKLTCLVISAVMLFSLTFAGCTRQSDADAVDTTKNGVIGSGIVGETEIKSTTSGAAAYNYSRVNRTNSQNLARSSQIKANSRLGDASYSYRMRSDALNRYSSQGK